MFSERSQLDGKSIRHVPSRRCRSARRSSGLSFEAACTVLDVLRKFTEKGTFRSSKVDILWNQYRDHVLAVSKHNLISTEGNFRLKTIKLELQFLICLKINLRPQATTSTRFTRRDGNWAIARPDGTTPKTGLSAGAHFSSLPTHTGTLPPPQCDESSRRLWECLQFWPKFSAGHGIQRGVNRRWKIDDNNGTERWWPEQQAWRSTRAALCLTVINF